MTTTYLSFNSRGNAEKFIGALLDHGATSDDISAIARDGGATLDAKEIEKTASAGITTTTAADFGKGAVAGTGVGLGVGLIAGLASLLVPGLGIVLGAGALSSAIAGAAATTAGGALVGGIAGFMRDMGVEGEVPDEFERDYTSDHVIVAVNSHVDGVSLEDLEGLAEKYHATRTTLNRTTVAAVPVDIETVKRPILDPVTGELGVTTVEVREPVGAAQIETVPVSQVVPIPGTNQVQPMLPREPEIRETAVPSAAVAADGIETARVENVVVRPAFPQTDELVREERTAVDEFGTPIRSEAVLQPARPADGDVFVERTVQEVHTEDGGIEGSIKRVTVNPLTGVTEREIIEPAVVAEPLDDELPMDSDDPSDRFYKA